MGGVQDAFERGCRFGGGVALRPVGVSGSIAVVNRTAGKLSVSSLCSAFQTCRHTSYSVPGVRPVIGSAGNASSPAEIPSLPSGACFSLGHATPFP